MGRFHYRAATTSGEILEGEMDAISEDDVLHRLHVEGYIPIRAVAVSRHRQRHPGGILSRLRGRRVSQSDIENLTLDLAMLIQAGFSTDGALKVQKDMVENESLRQILDRIHDRVRGGASLSAAMEAQDRIFSPLYINMVHAGEAAGALDEALHRLADFMERSRELRDTVTAALVYPVILVAVAIISLALILGIVVPRFTEMFNQAGQSLPWSTQVVVFLGYAVQYYWWLMVAVPAVGGWFLWKRLQDPVVRTRWDARLLRMPVAGALLSGIETARFSRTLGTLISNGIPLVKAIGIARASVNNRAVAGAIERAAERTTQGQGLARPLLEEGAVPRLAVHMLQVAEESGRMPEMLIRVADHYDREAQSLVRRLVALIEPALILGLGLVIGGIIMSIVAAVVDINRLSGL